jgi:hypothetical protein
MTPELQLILQCARARTDPGEIAAVVEGVRDWELFWSLAERHDLRSLCFWRLQHASARSIPSTFLSRLRHHFIQNTQTNLFRTGELFRVLELLDSGGVSAAVFKGPVFAWWSYENPGMREYGDLDLLVSSRHAGRAQQLLAEAGYRLEAVVPDSAMAWFFKDCGQIEMIHDPAHVVIDLHWDLAPRSLDLSLSADGLWPRLRTLDIAGRPVLSFHQNDQLLFAAWHGGKHGWTTLSWLADIAALLRAHSVDWEQVLADARDMRLARSLFVALWLVRDLLEIDLPAIAREGMESHPESLEIAREARSHLLQGPGAQPFFPRKLWYQIRLTEGRWRQLRLLWRKVTEPKISDWAHLPVQPRLFAAYYVARPFRLLAKYTRLARTRLPHVGSRPDSRARPQLRA